MWNCDAASPFFTSNYPAALDVHANGNVYVVSRMHPSDTAPCSDKVARTDQGAKLHHHETHELVPSASCNRVCQPEPSECVGEITIFTLLNIDLGLTS